MNLHIGEDGAALKLEVVNGGAAISDEHDHHLALLPLTQFVGAFGREDACARRLALARQFAESGEVLAQRDELAGALEACSMLDLDDGLCWCGDWATHHERQSDACKRARAALAHVKAGT